MKGVETFVSHDMEALGDVMIQCQMILTAAAAAVHKRGLQGCLDPWSFVSQFQYVGFGMMC